MTADDKKGDHMQYRQGDLLIETVEDEDEGPAKREPVAREDGLLILAYGEATGHTHAIADRNAEAYTTDDARVAIREIVAQVRLEHQEHDAIVLPAGRYTVTRQREYAPGALPRTVED
jgi:hypothetical protein